MSALPAHSPLRGCLAAVCLAATLTARLSVLHWEAEIDKLVYALYGLTPEEIAIVEGKK